MGRLARPDRRATPASARRPFALAADIYSIYPTITGDGVRITLDSLARQIDLEEGMLRVEQDATEILAIHQALDRLAGVDERLVRLVELRFFGGLSLKETADLMGVSERTARRDWTKARTLLFQMVQEQ